MERNEWSFSGTSTEREPLRPTLALFRTVAERSHARARRHLLCARHSNTHHDAVDDWEEKAQHVGPSDDEGIPAESQEATLNIPAWTLASPFSQ